MAMWSGLPGRVAISSWLRTKVAGCTGGVLRVRDDVFMVLGLAAAKTSAGAPLVMLAARVSLPPKLKVTFVPGWAVSNSLPSVVKLSLSEAAAKTATSPDGFDDADLEEPEPGAPESESESESEDEQADRTSSAATPAPAACSVRRVRRTERVITGPLPRSAR